MSGPSTYPPEFAGKQVGQQHGEWYWTGQDWATRRTYNWISDLQAQVSGTGLPPLLHTAPPLGAHPPAEPLRGADAAWEAPAAPAMPPECPAPPPPTSCMAFGKEHHLQACVQQVLQVLEPSTQPWGALRPGLLETPARVAKAYAHWFGGYDKNAGEILKVFEDGAEGCDEMVVVHDIPIYSHCEHHMAPIFGTATIGYLPAGKIVGLSKLSRLADMFARRLQVQERLTNNIADALMEHLGPRGCGVVVHARHMCMESRGVGHSSGTTTSALRGVFKDDASARAEFLQLANAKR